MTDEVSTEDGFSDLDSSTTGLLAAEGEGEGTKPAKAGRSKSPVTVTAISGHVIGSAPLSVSAVTVTGRPYTFDDIPKAYGWFDRRKYNGEPVAQNVDQFLEAVRAHRAAATFQTAVGKLQRWADELDTSKVSHVNVGTRTFAGLDEKATAIPEHSALEAYNRAADRVVELATLITTPASWASSDEVPDIEVDDQGIQKPESVTNAIEAVRRALRTAIEDLGKIEVPFTDFVSL